MNPTALKNWDTLVRLTQSCGLCPRLRNYCRGVAQKKRAAYQSQTYWGRPVSGFGALDAKLWILGLAPGAHGANRTGRVFTGDRSGDWLYRALFEIGLASSPQSVSTADGLTLHQSYISCVARCAPPQNQPTQKEIQNCARYLEKEKQLLLPHLQVILCLGAVAYQAACRLFEQKQEPKFAHGLIRTLPQGIMLICSYHPSQQNTFTGRLKWEAWTEIFSSVKKRMTAVEPVPKSTTE